MGSFLSFGESSRRIAEADSVVVIGLGRFGGSVALELMASGTEVLGIDADPDRVQEMNGRLTQVVRADATKEEVLRQLAVHEFDRAVIAISGDLKVSILAASLLLQLDGPVIWAKATDEQHGRILEQLGVHHVIYPEKDMGRRVAHLVRGAAKDYLEVDEGYALVKVSAPSELHGTALGATHLRERHGVTIAARRDPAGAWEHADTATVLREGDTVLVIGPTKKVERFAQLR
ncbi:potassium channel family protein [Microbacterium excoecariae]|uniref:potassium channel family protein n=1 Tax=Microbacterium excoecariae TaxID=2715210 RepID=UPI00197B2E53|nr:TrkA family potassium uptake protein [Microbacterium excoecariae]